MSKVRVLVVDDSATMRGVVTAILKQDPGIDVVGWAGDAFEARQAIKDLNPDVITLDIEMPNMNGLDFLEKIMRLRPMPVVMVSTLTQQGAEASLRALEIGAFDCIPKPISAAATEAFSELPEKVKAARHAKVRPLQARTAPSASNSAGFQPNGRIVAMGSSTGGVEALLTIISGFPANCPPTVITQHMPGTFTRSFAERLNRSTQGEVVEAREGSVLEPGKIYLAPGSSTHLQVVGTDTLRCRLVDSESVNGHRPSVDVLFSSVAKSAGSRAVGVILSGMGRDGAAGLHAMLHAGAKTLGQDEASSVVYGMPKAAFEIGAVERQLSLSAISGEILDLCNLERRKIH